MELGNSSALWTFSLLLLGVLALVFAFYKLPDASAPRRNLLVLRIVSWISWSLLLASLLIVGLAWPAPFTETEAQPEPGSMRFPQLLGHDGKTVYELEDDWKTKRVDLVLSDLFTGKVRKRISVLEGGYAWGTGSMSWNGSTLAFICTPLSGESPLVAIKNDSMIFRRGMARDEAFHATICWDEAKREWLLVFPHFSSYGSSLYVERYDENFSKPPQRDTLFTDEEGWQTKHYFFHDGNWWSAGYSGVLKASGSPDTLKFFPVLLGENTSFWIPSLSLPDDSVKYFLSPFGTQDAAPAAAFDSLRRGSSYFSFYTELRPASSVHRLQWNDKITRRAINFDTIKVVTHFMLREKSLLHGKASQEISWYGKDERLLHQVHMKELCDEIFLDGDTLIISGGPGQRALFRVSTGQRLDDPGMIATLMSYFEKPYQSNWYFLFPALCLMLLPLESGLRFARKNAARQASLRTQFISAGVYLVLSLCAWWIVVLRF